MNEERRDREPGDLLRRLQAEAQREPRLRGESARAWREFTGSVSRPLPMLAADAAAETIRFYEWYLLERTSEVLGATVVEALGADAVPMLRDSVAGVFLVEQVAGGEVRLRDLQDRNSYELTVHAQRLAAGDLLVGRLFPDAAGRFTISAGAGISRDGRELAVAFERDYRSLAPARRLAQAEIERIWFHHPSEDAGSGRPIEHLEADLAGMLADCGRDPGEAEALRSALRQESRPGRVIGPLLEELAFDSEVDLARARDLLLEIWQHYQAADPVAAPATRKPAVGPLGAALADRIEEGLRNHEDIEALFHEIEESIGDEGDESDEAEDGGESPRPEEPGIVDGDLASLIEEYLWETGGGQEGDAGLLRRFEAQQRSAPAPCCDLERISGAEIVRFLLHIYLARPVAERVASVRGAWECLQRFYAWAEETQGYVLHAPLVEAEQAWMEHLDRIHRAGVTLSSRKPPGSSPADLLRVVAVRDEGFEVAGGPIQDPRLVPLQVPDLRPGDMLVAGVRRGRGGEPEIDGIAVVLPGAVEPLFG